MNTRLIVALGAALAACDRPLSPDVARQTIEAHVRAVAPDVAPDSMSFPITEVVQVDEYSWEARFGEGETSGAMLLRRSSEGWTVAQYVDDATRDFMAGAATEQWLSGFDPINGMLHDVYIAKMEWENSLITANDPGLRRYLIATEFGPTRQMFDSIVAAAGIALPAGVVLNYTSGSLSGAAVAWGTHPDRPEVQCGVKLSQQGYVGEPELYWLAAASGVVCTDGTMSGSYESKFDEVRARLAVDGVLRP